MMAEPRPEEDHNELVTAHLELVGHVVNQVSSFYPRHVDRDELWSAGVMGLVEASRRFDPEVGVPFARYASIRIKGAIIDSTRSRDWASRRLRRRLREVETAEAAHTGANGQRPDDNTLAELVGCSVDELRDLREKASRATLLRLDVDTTEDGSTLADLVPETSEENLPQEWLENKELAGAVRDALRFLPEVQLEVLERYYLKGELLQEIAADLGVTEARTSQIRSQAINAIRAFLAEHYDGVPEVSDVAPGSTARQQFVAAVSAHSTLHTRLAAYDDSAANTALGVTRRSG
ncbi:MAG: sigma-70 family RNA polymerase sigma factor [Acidimicrobiia bacterium]